jgi:type I restriction enzyme S subunit
MISHVHTLKPIGNSVHDIKTWTPSSNGADDEFDYIDISSVDREAKRITSPTRVACRNAPSRARQIVRMSDVLVSSVRPALNGVAIVPPTLDGATASTGYCVLRANPEELDSRYLFYWVQTPAFVQDMSSKATGASYPAVSDRIVKESLIPLPPLPEQKRIADILDKADAIRRKRQEAAAEVSTLRRSIFLNSFGDPATNPRGWRESEFADILSGGMRNGISPSRAGRIPGKVLVLSAITGHAFDRTAVKESSFADPFGEDQLVNHSEFLICRGNGNIRLVGAGRFPTTSMADSVFPDTMIAARIDATCVVPEYLEELWATPHVRRQIESGARTTNGTYKVNQGILSAIRIPLPPLEEQRQYATSVKTIQRLHERLKSKEAGDLFHSLVQRAFKGEL